MYTPTHALTALPVARKKGTATVTPMEPRLPAILTAIALPTGFRAAGVHCGLKTDGVYDLGLLLAQQPVATSAVFTQNVLQGAHITVCREHLERSDGMARPWKRCRQCSSHGVHEIRLCVHEIRLCSVRITLICDWNYAPIFMRDESCPGM